MKDGHVAYETNDERLKQGIDNIDFEKLYVGRVSPDDFDSHYNENQFKSLNGKITNFNIWNEALTIKEMVDLTSCKNQSYGTVVSWSNAEWIYKHMKQLKVEENRICIRSNYTLFKQAKELIEIHRLCNKIGGNMNVISNDEENTEAAMMLTNENCEYGKIRKYKPLQS